MIKVKIIKEYLKKERLKARIVKAEKLPYKLKKITKNDLADTSIPDYLFLSDRGCYLFFRFNYELFDALNTNAKKKYFDDMEFYYKKLSKKYHTIIYVLVDSIPVVAADIVRRYKRSLDNNHFLQILPVHDNEILDLKLAKKYNLQGRILEPVLRDLKNCKNIKGTIGRTIRKFACEYLKAYKGDLEELPIDDFINDLLKANLKCCLKSTHIDFMEYIEKALFKMGSGAIRDHYYHACNTLLIGFLIIDKYYGKFANVFRKKIKTHDIEWIWTIISLFHDIGYPMEKLPVIICGAAGLNQEHEEKINEYLMKFRHDCWKDIKLYKEAIMLLDNMYSYLVQNNKKYHLAENKNRILNQEFHRGLRNAFVSHGYHGAVSAINLALTFVKIKNNYRKKRELDLLFSYLMYSCISILWHDWQTRESFMGISKINASDFPLAYLLTYIDILQEDRRELEDITKADIFEGVETDDSGAIVAILNRNELQSNKGLRDNLNYQLSKALNFYATEDLRFGIPTALLSESALAEKDGIRNLERKEMLEA